MPHSKTSPPRPPNQRKRRCSGEKSGKAARRFRERKAAATKEEPPVVTHHEIHVGGRVLHYTATTGYMPIRNEEGTEIEANIFFIAYTLDNAAPQSVR